MVQAACLPLAFKIIKFAQTNYGGVGSNFPVVKFLTAFICMMHNYIQLNILALISLNFIQIQHMELSNKKSLKSSHLRPREIRLWHILLMCDLDCVVNLLLSEMMTYWYLLLLHLFSVNLSFCHIRHESEFLSNQK